MHYFCAHKFTSEKIKIGYKFARRELVYKRDAIVFMLCYCAADAQRIAKQLRRG